MSLYTNKSSVTNILILCWQLIVNAAFHCCRCCLSYRPSFWHVLCTVVVLYFKRVFQPLQQLMSKLAHILQKQTRISVRLQKRCNLLHIESRINQAHCHSPPPKTLPNRTLHTLTKLDFLIHTVSYRPSFPRSIYGPSAKRPGHKLKGKK